VIGVARDAKYTNLREPAPPTVYDPYWPQNAAVLQVRTQLEMGALLAILREEIPRAHAAFRLADVNLQSTVVDNHLVRDRALALLSAFFSLVASVLVIVGVYGLLSYSVLQRTREIGIRLALGAQPAQIVALVLREVGGMMVVGLVIGGVGAALTGRFMTVLVYEVAPSDMGSIIGPLLALLTAFAFAAVIPAHRAARIPPTTALTVE
jgi:ABC-type antimicrobial peptide transport system permease subunit